MNGGLVSLEEIAATSLFGGSNSRCEMWWVSHSGQRPNQTGNPPQENSSLLCLFLQLLHSKHCCNTWNFQNPSGDIRNISSISIWTFKKKKNVKLKKLSVMFEVGKWQEKESNHEAFYFPREFHMDTHPSSFSQDSSSRSKHFQRKALMIQRNSNQKPWILHLGFSLFSSLRNLNSKKWNPN